MSAVPQAPPLPLEDYLSRPEYERCEYVDGQAVEINVGNKQHSRIQVLIAYFLEQYLRANPIGYAAAELHCKIPRAGSLRFRLPDVCAVIDDSSAESRYLDRSPDLVVEIRSPDDTITAQIRKMLEYQAAGTRLGWLVLPEEKSVFVFQPNMPVKTAVAGDVLDGADVLPGLAIPVENLFP